MATLHKGKNELAAKGFRYTVIGAIMMVCAAGLMLLGGAATLVFWISIPVFIIGRMTYHKGAKYQSGDIGERATLDFLMTLPEGYHVFTSVKVHEKMEADAVVVGENGVFVVESKAYKGRLEGSAEDRTWIMHKVGRKGGSYSKTIPNPLEQLKRNIFSIASYLKAEGCPAWVEGCVVFPHPDTTFGSEPGFFDRAAVSSLGFLYKMEDEYVPDSRCIRPKALVQYILGYQPRRKLTAKQITDISTSLDKCIEPDSNQGLVKVY